LKSPDFFEAEKFPQITFKGRKIEKIDDEEFKLYGNLTIRDITKPIELKVIYGGTITDPWGKTRAGFKVLGSINRFDYNLKWNALIETGGAVVGKTINIICDVEVVK
jgi:polyisoprenoid-binding protein YceI